MNPFELPPDYHKAIGVLTTEFAGLERLTTSCIMYCSSISTWDEVFCLVGGDEYGALLKKLEKLVNTNLKDEAALLAQFKPILKSLTGINEDRNTYTHSLWFIPPLSILLADPHVVRRKFLRNFNPAKGLEDVEPTPIAMLDECIKKISDAKSELSSFFYDNIETINAAVDRRKKEAIRAQTAPPYSSEPI